MGHFFELCYSALETSKTIAVSFIRSVILALGNLQTATISIRKRAVAIAVPRDAAVLRPFSLDRAWTIWAWGRRQDNVAGSGGIVVHA